MASDADEAGAATTKAPTAKNQTQTKNLSTFRGWVHEVHPVVHEYFGPVFQCLEALRVHVVD